MHFSFKEVMSHTQMNRTLLQPLKYIKDLPKMQFPKVTSGNSTTFDPTFAENVIMELQLPPAKICLLKALSSGGVTCKQLDMVTLYLVPAVAPPYIKLVEIYNIRFTTLQSGTIRVV